MSTKAIVFSRTEAQAPAEDLGAPARKRTTQVNWAVIFPEGTGLTLVVSKGGIDTIGGAPAFDSQREENAWRFQTEMAIVALRFIKQHALVPPDEQLAALVISTRDPD